jgi:TonB family protein
MTFRFLLALLMAGGAWAQSPDDALSQGRWLTASQAQAVEESLRANPEDLGARGKLIAHYFVNQAREPWSQHVFWLIEHHPESPLAGSKFASGALPADPLNGEADLARAKELWLEQTRRHPDDARVWANALRFCSQAGCDSEVKERLLIHAEELGITKAELAVAGEPPTRIRVGGDEQAAMQVKKVDPACYPSQALQAGIQGVVRFAAVIGTDGHVQDLQVISGHPLLIRVAQEAVRQWVYRPTLLNGKPVEVSTEIDIPFTFTEGKKASAPPPADAAPSSSETPCDGRTFTIGVAGSLVGGSVAPEQPVTRVRVGGNVQAAMLVNRVEPAYPRDAWVEGTVRFTAIIGTDGHVRNLQLVSGPPQLAPAALNAVMQWVYQPTLLNGKPVEVVTTIDVPFTLPASR